MTRLLAILIAILWATTASARSGDLSVMTANVRVAVASDGVNIWPNRRDLLGETIRRAAPDVIATQELTRAQADDLAARLPDYAWLGRDRDGGRAGEHMGVFYRRDRLRVIETGDFWLSDTPEVVGSITWGHPYPRMVTWVLFADRAGRRFHLFNTHFPYRAEDETARTKAARLIAARIHALPAGTPVVLTGDFNTGPDSEAHAILTGLGCDAWQCAPHKGPAETFHGFTGNADRRIDWIIARGFAVRSTETITVHRGAIYPSDHFPVFARLRWPDR